MRTDLPVACRRERRKVCMWLPCDLVASLAALADGNVTANLVSIIDAAFAGGMGAAATVANPRRRKR